MKTIYLILAIVGFLAPYYFFLQLPAESWLDLPSLIQPLSANNFMRGITADLTIAALTFGTFVFAEANRQRMKHPWLYVLAMFLVGLSFALPLFLYVRERHLETKRTTNH